MKEIKFSNEAKGNANALGRNGWMRLFGLEIRKYSKITEGNPITITAVNSKGLGRCELNLPKDHLQEIILAMVEESGISTSSLIRALTTQEALNN